MGKPTYVLGTGLSHDGSCCLLKDGRVAVAIEKERITRRKHDGGNDTHAIRYCLDAEGITIDDVALVVQNANFSMFERGNGWFEGPRILADRIPVVTISHHLAHAYSALAASPFEEAAVLVVDGCGNAYDECVDREGARVPVDPLAPEVRHLYFEKDSYYLWRDGRMRPLFKDFSPWGLRIRDYPMCPPTTMHSIGGLYAAASIYAVLGLEDPGKLMGLAPWGRPGAHDFEIFDLRDGRAFVRYDWMGRFDNPSRGLEHFQANFQYYADLAWWVQREVERALLYVLGHRFAMAPSENLAYGGGVALNAVANRRILREGPFRNVFFQPAAGDNGLALGAAHYGWLVTLGRERVLHDGSTCFGRAYPRSEVEAALDRHAGALEVERADDVVRRTAELLAEGKVVGWFQGGSEFGPRALGHRSILADPRREGVRDFINAKVKLREDFRPFAPSVLLEDAPLYFDCDRESPYMILVAPVRPEWRDRIPAVVHRDGSCRIHTVTETSDPRYHALLKEFRRAAGLSVLLNTSFNRRGMPIVESPLDAVELFLASALDVLVMDDRVVRKREAPAPPRESLERLFRQDIPDRLLSHRRKAAALKGTFEFRVQGVRTWTVDLTNERPHVFEGESEAADVVLELAEEDLRAFLVDPARLEAWFLGQGAGSDDNASAVVRLFRLLRT